MKEVIKCTICCLLFCFVLIGIGKFFRYILTDDTASYTRITFHEMYNQDSIDILFVGSSHCYRSFVPEIFDEALGENTFNAGTSSQNLDGSYMVIREAARYYDIKHIYLELYYDLAFEVYKNRTDMTQTYIISDYLRPSLDKIQYLLNASTKEHYPNSFIIARRNWKKFFDQDYVKNLIIKKGADAYKNYEYTYATGFAGDIYVGKGFVTNEGSAGDWNFYSARAWDLINIDDVSEDWIHSLEDIIAFCEKEDISLTLISAPMSNYLLAGIENYDEFVKLVQGIVAETNVDYYDFNLCKEEYFPNTSLLFKDADHLNDDGAETFSYLLADFINGEVSEDELFYGSYNEKLEKLEPTVFGISYHDEKNENGELARVCRIISTGNDNLEYEVSVLSTEGDAYKIQDYSGNRYFNIVPEEHGKIIVAYRLKDCPNKVRKANISF